MSKWYGVKDCAGLLSGAGSVIDLFGAGSRRRYKFRDAVAGFERDGSALHKDCEAAKAGAIDALSDRDKSSLKNRLVKVRIVSSKAGKAAGKTVKRVFGYVITTTGDSTTIAKIKAKNSPEEPYKRRKVKHKLRLSRRLSE